MEYYVKVLLLFLLTYNMSFSAAAACQHENEIPKDEIHKSKHFGYRVTTGAPFTTTNSPLNQDSTTTSEKLIGETNMTIENSTDVGCVCALFTSQFPAQDDVPLMSKSFHNVSCHDHESGEDVCIKVCISFALTHYQEKDEIICSHAYNATDITGYLHTKVNNDLSKWIFSGLSTSKPVCCNGGRYVSCEEQRTKPSQT